MKETVAVWPFTVTAVASVPPLELAGETQEVGAAPGKMKCPLLTNDPGPGPTAIVAGPALDIRTVQVPAGTVQSVVIAVLSVVT